MEPEFHPISEPFPSWVGPYTPRRGFSDGYSVTADGLVIQPWGSIGREKWVAESTFALRVLTSMVTRVYKGGHVKILPDGHVVKPRNSNETGTRHYLGKFEGGIQFTGPGGRGFDPGDPGDLEPGDEWPYPYYGLEATIDGSTGRLVTKTPFPKRGEEHFIRILTRDQELARGFRAARPRDGGGRVRILESGVVLTNRQDRHGEWMHLFVGRIDLADFLFDEDWIVDAEDRRQGGSDASTMW